MGHYPPASANALRREVHTRNLHRAESTPKPTHDLTFGEAACVVYRESEAGLHGNFLDASYRRICADPAWSRRLQKSYTSAQRIPRATDYRRAELDSASSSDALLMNIFCHPRILHRPSLCNLLGVDAGLRPEFGVRANIAMARNEVDRTEIDMRLGSLLVEAKLTESGFGTASRERLMRYIAVPELFDVDDLPWRNGNVHGYQLVRGLIAAHTADTRFMMLFDVRRADLPEIGFQVLRATRSSDLRSRLVLRSWQEIAATLPHVVQEFLAVKYGIVPQV